jgi:hypothetical protein
MNKEKYNQIIDEAYENYSKEYEKDNSIGMCLLVKRLDGKSTYRKPNKEMFVDLCTSDKTFSEKRGLKIEEQELSFEERYHIWFTNNYETGMERHFDPNNIPKFDDPYYEPTPTKLITITYNDKTIESYE